jgi:phosphatidylethanolamine-binding protein (PEBP) family uncharacterized protein
MTGTDARSAEILLTSAAFEQGAPIPYVYTCEGNDISPPLAWSGAPVNTRTYALVCDDPDAPRGPYTHWILYNISGDVAYAGPCPPPGKPHRYFFRLYALDISLNLPPGATKNELEQAMDQHILAQGTLMGTYQHRP